MREGRGGVGEEGREKWEGKMREGRGGKGEEDMALPSFSAHTTS